jgi:hypothetical protein
MQTLTNPKNAETVDSSLSTPEALNALRTNLGTMTGWSKNFTTDILTKRDFSDSQLYWIHKLAMDLLFPQPKPVVVHESVGDFTKVADMVANAFKGGAKRLKIRLLLPDGTKISLCPYAPGGKFVAVYVNDPEDHYNSYGRILPNGDFQPPRGQRKVNQDIFNAVLRFANDPIGVAKEYGKLEGSCCFCGRPLTVDRSVDLGYGPVCAERLGLISPY